VPTITINPVAITANAEKDSAANNVPSNLRGVGIQLTDSAGNATPLAGSNWLTTTGNIKCFGVQVSADGFVSDKRWLAFIGDTTLSDPTRFLPFGSLGKNGQMPRVDIGSSQIVAASGNQVRLAVVTDTNITLGAVITTTA
jgi:hypothetical protein